MVWVYQIFWLTKLIHKNKSVPLWNKKAEKREMKRCFKARVSKYFVSLKDLDISEHLKDYLKA